MNKSKHLQAAQPAENPSCIKCRKTDDVRLLLRSCGHICCLKCLLYHLKYWIKEKSKARIKCPCKKCPKRIHENDIAAVFDEQEHELDNYMDAQTRKYLHYQHNKHQIIYALGGKEKVRNCPLCKSIYTLRPGCHYVRCANSRCGIRFCWECSSPVYSAAHFTGLRCHISFLDLYRTIYFLMVFDDASICTIVLAIPLVFICLILFLPIYVAISIPRLICQRKWEKMTERSDLLTKEEKQVFIFQAVTLTIVVLPFSTLAGILSLGTACTLCALYLIAAFAKASPCAIMRKICGKFFKIASLFGYNDWQDIIKAKYEHDENKHLTDMHKRAERSERADVVAKCPQKEEEEGSLNAPQSTASQKPSDGTPHVTQSKTSQKPSGAKAKMSKVPKKTKQKASKAKKK